jgi:hypothetical protein
MRIDKVHEELDWFFSDRAGAAGELGAPSTYGAMEAQALAGPGTGSNAFNQAGRQHDRLIALIPSASRWRAIAEVLHRLPHHEQLLLEHAHGDRLEQRAHRERFRDLLGDVAPVVVALHGLPHVRELVAGAKKDPNRRARVVELRLEVERAVAKAHFAFWQLACERLQNIRSMKDRDEAARRAMFGRFAA